MLLSLLLILGIALLGTFTLTYNLSNRETPDLSTLLNMLDLIHMTSQLDNWLWILEASSLFTCKSLYSYLINNPSVTQCHFANAFRNARVLSKVKIFSGTAINQRLNINDLLQICRSHRALSPDVCVMCFRDFETHSHFFLHSTMSWKTWTDIISFSLYWVAPPTGVSF